MPDVSLPTQQFVEIKQIKDGIVYLKKGGVRKILIVSGVNFDLKSEAEQGLILGLFQNFLNTLDFPAQFFIHSRKVNIGTYLDRMRVRYDEETNELLKIQIAEYIEFIKSFVRDNAIISKTFFVVVPYDGASMGGAANGILGFFGLGGKPKAATKEQDVNTQEILKQLDQRVNQVMDGVSEIGLRAVTLNNDELTELFYNLYNPQLIERRGIEIAKK